MTPERWKRIEELYHAAQARAASERAAFLVNACPDDPALRQEVEALLNETESAGFLAGALVTPSSPGVLDEMIGRDFGGYRLQTLLGAGGMGEVYLAHDTKLGRDVAIKVLPREFTSDLQRLARFEREARMLAALNHPNICGIYGIDAVDGTRFLVLELVEGETLAARLAEAAGKLPVRDALTIARALAAALEAAHERGIIHRDLKPANIKITPAHIVKVLDFGLAKSVAGDGPGGDLTQAPTGSETDGRAGAIMGTAAYMSPEQARGLTADKRSDVWAFAVVLFEMIAGQRPFRGGTASDVLAAILKTEPDWSELPPAVPSDLRRLLHRCLQKDPNRRLQSMADARVQVEDLLRGDDEEPFVGGDVRGARVRKFSTLSFRNPVLAWAVAVIAVIAAAVGWIRLLTPDQQPLFFSSALPPASATLATEESPVLSPDGLRLAFVAYDAGGKQRLFVAERGADGPAKPLERTEGASLPFWSPDGRSMGFFAQGLLKTVDIFTGHTRTLANAGGPRGGTWSQHGVIVYVPSPRAGPYRVNAAGDGTDAVPLPSASGGSPGGWFPSFLPDGRHFLEFVPTVKQPENASVWVVALDTGTREKLVDSRSNAVFARGHLLHWQAGSIWAQPFDSETRQVHGDLSKVADAVGLNPVTNQALFSASVSGDVAYFSGAVGETELVWFDRQGNEINRPGIAGVIATIALSPDDTSVVFDVAAPATATFDIWRLEFGRRREQLTFNPANDVFPLWNGDGKHIAFMSARERPPQVYKMLAAAAGTETVLFKALFPVVPSGWSRDGTFYYTATDPVTATGDIWSLSPGTNHPTPFVKTLRDERYGTPSPDGRWLAYVSNASDTYEVYVRSLDGRIERRISTAGGTQPRWRDDTELIYLAPDRALMAVAVTGGAGMFDAGVPQRLFSTRTKMIEIQGTTRSYAVARDGQRFLVANATEEAKSASIRFALNRLSSLPR